jgi:hypothetical protein
LPFLRPAEIHASLHCGGDEATVMGDELRGYRRIYPLA